MEDFSPVGFTSYHSTASFIPIHHSCHTITFLVLNMSSVLPLSPTASLDQDKWPIHTLQQINSDIPYSEVCSSYFILAAHACWDRTIIQVGSQLQDLPGDENHSSTSLHQLVDIIHFTDLSHTDISIGKSYPNLVPDGSALVPFPPIQACGFFIQHC